MKTVRSPRFFVWVLAVLALLLQPVWPAHAMQLAQSVATVDCPDHVPADPCPDAGTSRHAAGDCCPLMSNVVAVLAVTVDVGAPGVVASPARPPSRHLIGRTFSQDPPPPRV